MSGVVCCVLCCVGYVFCDMCVVLCIECCVLLVELCVLCDGCLSVVCCESGIGCRVFLLCVVFDFVFGV